MRTAIVLTTMLANLLPAGYGFAADPERFEFESRQMGTMFRIVAYGEKESVEKAKTDAIARITELDQIFSDYKTDSETTKLCKANDKMPNVFRPVSREMLHVLTKAKEISGKSDDSFDVTIGPLVQLWRISRRTQELPDAKELADAKNKVGSKLISLDRDMLKVKLEKPGMRLDFGGIVKGYAADEALAIFQKAGISQVLIAASGDIRTGTAPPGKKGWDVEITPLGKGMPPRHLILADQAVSTSGDLFQSVEIKGTRYSHVLDPKTGLGLTGWRSVTVIAPKGIDADSLTKACSVLPLDRAKALIDSIKGAAFFIAEKQKESDEPTFTQSDHFADYVKPTTPKP
ncbi:MAG: FAD:protein FMN transferase [Gemmataceae bacterium]